MDVLDTLTPREEKGAALCASAWRTAGQRTLEEVGKEFDVTRETHPPDRGQGAAQAASSQPAARN